MGIKELLRFVQLRKLNIHKEDFLLGVNESSDISDFRKILNCPTKSIDTPPPPIKTEIKVITLF